MTTDSTLSRSDVSPPPPVVVPGEVTVIWVLWATYGSFYFCRQNISTAVMGMQSELHFNKIEIGYILGGLKMAYAIGQLVNGQLAERLSARQLLAIGMFGSAALNVVFGFSTGLYFLLFIWACNGYCQALGWTPCMRVAANWIPSERRGRVIGILGTSYQIAAALTFILAGQCVEWWGWRGAFFLPALLLALAGVHMLLLLREKPHSAPAKESSSVPHPVAASGGWRENLHATLANPRLWVLAVTLLLLDACRYGYTDWGLNHLTEVQGAKVRKAALQYAVLPAGGAIGALLAGWATDRYFTGRRAPVMVGLLTLLGSLTLFYDQVARSSLEGTIALLVLVGFCIFGAQVLLVGTAPADLAHRGTAAAAAGFVNFMGYLGAFSGDYVTGYAVEKHGWQTACAVWAAWAFAAAVAAAFLWNAKARHN